MPTLDWIGKDAVIRHHKEVPFRLLEPDAVLADFVWFTETGAGRQESLPHTDSPMLGTHDGRGVYLLFNGILGDRRPQGGNILTKAVLDTLPPHDRPKTIYAAATRLGPATLQREQIVFKQTPYAIEV